MRLILMENAGLSIVELMVALVVLSVGILPVFGLYDVISRQGLLEKQKATAMSLAADKLESVKSDYIQNPWVFIEYAESDPEEDRERRLLYSPSTVKNPYDSYDTEPQNGIIYNIAVSDSVVVHGGNLQIDFNSPRIDPDDNDSPHGNQLIKIEITVSWSWKGTDQSVSVATYVTSR